MAKIRLNNSGYIPGGYVPGQAFRPVQWRLAGNYTPEQALQISSHLRSRGVTAEAIADRGGDSLEPPSTTRAPVTETVVWPDTWRLAPIEKYSNGTYGYKWFDYVTSSEQSVSGSNPQEVVNRLHEIDHPVYTRLIETLPTIEPEKPTTIPVNAPTDGRMLRPADQWTVEHTMPERRVQAPSAQQAIDFEKYVDSLSVAELKEKMKHRDFVARMDALPPKNY